MIVLGGGTGHGNSGGLSSTYQQSATANLGITLNTGSTTGAAPLLSREPSAMAPQNNFGNVNSGYN